MIINIKKSEDCRFSADKPLACASIELILQEIVQEQELPNFSKELRISNDYESGFGSYLIPR